MEAQANAIRAQMDLSIFRSLQPSDIKAFRNLKLDPARLNNPSDMDGACNCEPDPSPRTVKLRTPATFAKHNTDSKLANKGKSRNARNVLSI